jgi:hypothetical protein
MSPTFVATAVVAQKQVRLLFPWPALKPAVRLVTPRQAQVQVIRLRPVARVLLRLRARVVQVQARALALQARPKARQAAQRAVALQLQTLVTLEDAVITSCNVPA